MEEFELNEEKFKELLLYLATQCEGDRYFGATKVNKQLFFADFLAYANLGRPITGAEYMALEFGPAPRRLRPLREELIEDGDLSLDRRKYQERIVAHRPPNLKVFTKQELKIINQVIEELRGNDANDVSQLSHRFLGWAAARAEGQATGENVTIPYSTVFVSNAAPQKGMMAHGRNLARKYEWPVD